MSSSVNSRSLHGCWTCRVRKKKCDENRPVCLICLSLELVCDGYGIKPPWMDSGPLQRAEALRLKSVVSQTNSQRRRTRIRSQSLSQKKGEESDMIHRESEITTIQPNDYSYSQNQQHEPSLDENVLEIKVLPEVPVHSWDVDFEFTDEDILSALSQENIFSESYFDNDQYIIENSNEVALDHDQTLFVDSETNTVNQILKSQSVLNLRSAADSANFQNVTQVEECQTAASNWSLLHHSLPADQYSGGITQHNDMEDSLLMHYLDEVFSIQFSFFSTPNKQFRGWLFSTLRRVKSVYFATLALSERHLGPREQLHTSIQSHENQFLETALREMKVQVTHSTSIVDKIFCIVQILFYEQFSGGTGPWQLYLSQAISLVEKLPTQSTSGAKLLLGSIITFDVIGSASTRSALSLKLDHKKTLKDFEINLSVVIGCTNEIIMTISDIVHLDNWKKDAEKCRKLSMVELVRRASGIDELLRQQLKIFDSQTEAPSCDSDFAATQVEISKIYALAALSYLHVVVSGAHPEMPEIEESVARTITAFQSLSDPKWLRHLVWPFCVSGCLAGEKHQASFRELIAEAKARATIADTGALFQAFGIMEECWEMRRTCSYNCDWVFVMNKRGSKILLM